MCKPIEYNTVRPRYDFKALPLEGSSGSLLQQESITLKTEWHGLVEGPDQDDPDRFIVLFEHGQNETLRVSMHHEMIKGVE